ncbi:phosphopentomutase [Lacticaseibacillus parakribbianus]|uniref:phosphopentomutase n=1 Tax=Lacticaseibacillus parakribbianus TaxID=2970927 RepID=UPI0021CB258C|nr:phosphopentomutase [Lacticaseibacillus parakribbianus]
MPEFKRIIAIVTDSIGIGAAPDAAKYQDAGADTLGHIGDHFAGRLHLPNWQRLGLGNIARPRPIPGVGPVAEPSGYFGKMFEVSAGKDSMDGHWEMMGLPVLEPLGFFPHGFPRELIAQIEAFSGRKVIVNLPYSGTEVIAKFGEQQLATGDLIVYTSGDSVLQIAANTAVIPLAELYRICEYVRSITTEQPYRIGRVIARPYVGDSAATFTRTSDRHDYALMPNAPTDLDRLQAAGVATYGVGKINDIFSGQGLDAGVHTVSNADGMVKTIEAVQSDRTGFIFTNLVDFDAMYGHRRNAQGDGEALEAFDRQLGELLAAMAPDDLLLITSDHGNDPGFTGTDHTREYVPLIAYSKALPGGGDLGVRSPFADLGATVLANFGVAGNGVGASFLGLLK